MDSMVDRDGTLVHSERTDSMRTQEDGRRTDSPGINMQSIGEWFLGH